MARWNRSTVGKQDALLHLNATGRLRSADVHVEGPGKHRLSADLDELDLERQILAGKRMIGIERH